MNDLRILVVDDEKRILATMKRFLLGRGHQVALAESASEALLALSRGAFDVIVCDLHMPGLNGAAFAAKLAPLDAKKVVFMTAAAGREAEGLLLEGSRVLLKPFSTEELFDVIDEVAEETCARPSRRPSQAQARRSAGQ